MRKLSRFKWPILLIVLGVVLNLAGLMAVFSVFRESGTSFVGPGQVLIPISKPGEYTLWHQSKTFIDGQFFSFPDDLPPGTIIKVLKQPDGTAVPLRGGGGSIMTSGGTRRVSIGQITCASSGQYQVIVTGLAEKHAFYLDEAKLLRAFVTVIAGVAFGMLFLFAGIVWGIYVIVQLSRGLD